MSIGKDELISLQDATQYCDYSQDYLSLRARQGKLKAVKIGRNWKTSKHWLKDYIATADAYKKSIEKERDIALSLRVLPSPPDNLPIEDLETFEPQREISAYTRGSLFAFSETVRIAAAFVMVLMLAGFTTVLGRDSFQHASIEIAEESFMSSVVTDTFVEYRNWLVNEFDSLGNRITEFHHNAIFSIRSIGQEAGEYIAPEQRPAAIANPNTAPIPTRSKNGLIIVPSSENNEKMKAQIQQSFSDEIVVTPQDKDSGIITPVFRDHTGEDYLYILVPLHEEQ